MVKAWLVIGAATAAYSACLFLAGLLAGADVFPGAAAVAWLELWLPWLLLAPPARRLAMRFPIGARVLPRSLVIHAAAFAILLSGHVGMDAFSRWLITGMEEGVLRYAHALLFGKGALLLDALIYGFIVAVWNWGLQQERLQEKSYDAMRLGKNLTESRLQTLKMQLNPHFLFNTLNSVSVLVEKNDTVQAQEMIGELSRFLRQTLSSSGEKWVSLEKELEMLRHYLSIEKIRFGHRFSYHEECEPLALAAKIPPMLLQPLFENAIVHGLAEKEGACRLNFECRVHDRRLFILISDNGAGFDSSKDPRHKAGIGLANVEARLREVYGGDYTLSLEKAYPQGTLVALKIPAYKDSIFRRETA